MDFKLRYAITADGKQAKNELADVERHIDKLAGRSRSGGRRGSGMLDVLGGNLASQGISQLTSLLVEGGKAVLDYSATLEQTKIGFEALMGSAQAAGKHIEELRNLSTSTPLEFQSITKMSQRLQGAGVEAGKVTKLIEDIGNVAAATGEVTAERLEGIGVAISQILSKGRLSAEEMEQLAERGIPAWRILSQQMGKSVEETRKLAEQGKISGEVMVDAFQKFSRAKFGDAMKKQAETFTGAMNIITNTVMVTAEQAFRPLFVEISKIATKANKEIQAQKGDFSKMGVTLGTAMGEAFGLALGTAIRVAVTDLAKGMSPVPSGSQGSVFFQSLFGLGRGTFRGATDSLSGDGRNRVGEGSITFPNYARPNGRRWVESTRPTTPGSPGAVSGRSNADAAAEARRAAAEAARIAERDLAAMFGIESILNQTIQDQFAKSVDELVAGFDVRDGSDGVFAAITSAFKLYRDNLEASLKELEKLERAQLDVQATANEIALLEANQGQRRLELNEQWIDRRDAAIETIKGKEKEAAEERFRLWQMEWAWEQKLYDQAQDRLELERKRNEEEMRRVMESIGGPADDAGITRTLDLSFSNAALSSLDEATGKVRNMHDVMGQLGTMAAQTFMAMGEGLGNMLGQWVLLGDQAEMSMQKMVASILSGVAAQAATLAIFHTAMGIAALTPWGAAMYGPAAFQFKAAALWAGIAAGAAIAGRAVAGNSFQSDGSAGGGDGGGSSSSSQANPAAFSRSSPDAFISGRRDSPVEALAAAVTKLEQKIGGMSPGDVLVAGSRQRKGFIGMQTARDIRTNAASGTVLLKNAGFRN